jgi:restriction system protein
MDRDALWKRKELDKDWERYRDKIQSLSKQVADLNYDRITVYTSTAPRYRWVADTSDRYLLPLRSQWLSADELFEPPPIPDFPSIPEPPKKLHLEKSQYDSWYLEPKDGKPSYFDNDVVRRKSTLTERDALQELISAKKRDFTETCHAEAYRLSRLRTKHSNEEPNAITELIEIADQRHCISYRVQKSFCAFADPNTKVVLIELQFPDFTKHRFEVDRTVVGKKIKYATETQKKKIVRQCLYSIVIRAGYLASKVLESTSYKTIAINVSQDWFDPATGVPRIGIICSLQAQVSEFSGLHLDQVDPEACFRHLKGIAVPSFDSISPVRPIFVLNKSDERFIETRNLDAVLTPEANLAAMPWEDFEQLVAQLFEWEFVKEGVEVRVTRVSRDRGVDAVLFDPHPLRGGKFVLQAKRYTKPVDVAAVRDLYGTVVNEGANRGILITTSSYGPDSYAFAKDKPISLVDGPNLLVMLRRHGKQFRIDLEEARRLNGDRGEDII